LRPIIPHFFAQNGTQGRGYKTKYSRKD